MSISLSYASPPWSNSRFSFSLFEDPSTTMLLWHPNGIKFTCESTLLCILNNITMLQLVKHVNFVIFV